MHGGPVGSSPPVTVTGPFLNGLTGSYSSSGISLGLDYRVALTDKLSPHPFLMTSAESVSNVSSMTASHGIPGRQPRYWIGDACAGGYLASYPEVVKFGNTGIPASASGGRAGRVAGRPCRREIILSRAWHAPRRHPARQLLVAERVDGLEP